MEINPKTIMEWLKLAVIGKMCTPTVLHVLHSDDPIYAKGYDAYRNPPDIIELACAYIKVCEQLEKKNNPPQNNDCAPPQEDHEGRPMTYWGGKEKKP